MFCRKCGSKLPDDSRFCPACGEKVIVEEVKKEEIIKEVVVQEKTEEIKPEIVEETTQKEPRGPWKAFAIAGYVIGIFSIAGCMIPVINSYVVTLGEFGIILSALGLRSIKNHSKAKTGLTLSIIGWCVSIVVYTIISLVLQKAAMEYYMELFEYFFDLLEGSFCFMH